MKKDILEVTKSQLDIMKDSSLKNYLSFEEFNLYYVLLKKYISLGAIDYIDYAKTLKNSVVIINTSDQLEIYNNYKEKLNSIISENIEKTLN